jgi:hypothetical protein
MGWNVFKDCLKRMEIDSLDEPEPMTARSLNELEWTFVFERFGALAKKEAYVIKSGTDTMMEKLKGPGKAPFTYTLDLRYFFS